MEKSYYDMQHRKPCFHREYWVQATILDLAQEVNEFMQEVGLSKKQMATLAGVKPKTVKRVLQGDPDLAIDRYLYVVYHARQLGLPTTRSEIVKDGE